MQLENDAPGLAASFATGLALRQRLRIKASRQVQGKSSGFSAVDLLSCRPLDVARISGFYVVWGRFLD